MWAISGPHALFAHIRFVEGASIEVFGLPWHARKGTAGRRPAASDSASRNLPQLVFILVSVDLPSLDSLRIPLQYHNIPEVVTARSKLDCLAATSKVHHHNSPCTNLIVQSRHFCNCDRKASVFLGFGEQNLLWSEDQPLPSPISQRDMALSPHPQRGDESLSRYGAERCL